MGVAAELGLRYGNSSALGRAVRWFAGSRPGAWISSRILPHLDPWTHRRSGGRTTVSDLLSGVPTIFLTTTGARSGLQRTAQLIAVPAGADVAVIGSNFGRAAHPGWVANLAADPRATLSHRGRSLDVIARELGGAEAEQVWADGRALNRGFATYPAMAAGRSIRIFKLERR
jgi:deazaflavin-dependent oxidoreductase (nitroreductase family)